MRAAGIKTPVPLEELESHLREEIETQMRSGVPAERAFAVAVERFGDSARLHEEFEKAADPLKARRLKRMRMLLIAFALFFVIFEPASLAFFSNSLRDKGIDVTAGDWLLVFGASISVLLFIPAGRWVARFLPPIVSEWRMAIAVVSAAFAAALLLRLVWSVMWTDSVLHEGIIEYWSMSPWIGLTWCGLDWVEKCEAARRQSRTVAS